MKVGLFGANGRMGRVLIDALDQNENTVLSVATVRDDSPWVGMNVGELAGIGKKDVNCSAISSLSENDADVMIDFTLPVTLESNLQWCVDTKTPVVIGTTGLSETQLGLLLAPEIGREGEPLNETVAKVHEVCPVLLNFLTS